MQENSSQKKLLDLDAQASGQCSGSVLVVDLDGTLIKSDLLHEMCFGLMKRHPLDLFKLPFWLAKSKAELKTRLAERADIDVTTLPYDEDLLAYLRTEHATGRRIWLATATHQLVADRVAAHLGIFERVLATNRDRNLSGRKKLETIRSELRSTTFDYAGNAMADLQIWQHADTCIVVGASKRLEKLAGERCASLRVMHRPGPRFGTYVKALRLHQWVKNILVFVPLVLAHAITNWELLLDTVAAFFAFGLAASSAYVLNDLADLQADRRHHRKRHRPFASGALSVLTGVALIPTLLFGAFAITLLLPGAFALVLLTYLVGTLSYSLRLKRHPMIDVLALAGLYTLRIIGGVVAISISMTFWLLAFSTFFFFSLALVKRYTELRTLANEGREEVARGYVVGDLVFVMAAGLSSGYLAVLVLALYLHSPDVLRLYETPEIIWPVCFLLMYWVSRMWMKAERGNIDDDPIVFALSDWPSYIVGLIVAAIIAFAGIA